MTNPLAALSDSILSVVASVAPLLCVIRTGPNQQTTGMLFHRGVIVAVDRALPIKDAYTAVLSTRVMVSARNCLRDADANLAVLRTETPIAAPVLEAAIAPVGSLVVVLGADSAASPTVRLTVIHRFVSTPDGPAPVLDLPGASLDPGGPVLDPSGRLLGLAATGPGNEAVVIPVAALQRVVVAGLDTVSNDSPRMPQASIGGTVSQIAPQGRRGWLGVALQPITVPDKLVPKAGQTSGRMVVNVIKGGPADKAGLRVGDVLLALNDTSTTGPHALRAFLGADRIGTGIDVRLVRDGTVLTTHLVVGAQSATPSTPAPSDLARS